jgi:hypothetical protein
LVWQNATDGLDLTLKTRHMLERSDLIQNHHPIVRELIGRLVAHPYYLRCIASAEGTLALDGRRRSLRGTAICEQMVLRALNPARVGLP